MLVERYKREARLAICRGCQFFDPKFKTCGPPEGEKSNFHGKEIELCGCESDSRSWYVFATCAAGKWPNDQDAEAIKAELLQIRANGSGREYAKRVSEIKSALIGKDVQVECDTCLHKDVNEMLKEIARVSKK